MNEMKPPERVATPLSLHVPEPPVRPGGKPDFSHVAIPEAGSVRRPAGRRCGAHEIRDLAYSIDPRARRRGRGGRPLGRTRSTPAVAARPGCAHMMKTRAYDARMLMAQRQGKTSFYMQCTRRGGGRLRASARRSSRAT